MVGISTIPVSTTSVSNTPINSKEKSIEVDVITPLIITVPVNIKKEIKGADIEVNVITTLVSSIRGVNVSTAPINIKKN